MGAPLREAARKRRRDLYAVRDVAEHQARLHLPGGRRQAAAVGVPGGANVLAEYWLETEAPRVIAVMEAESMEPFGQIRMDWNEMFEIEVFPVVTAEQGMEMARQAMSS